MKMKFFKAGFEILKWHSIKKHYYDSKYFICECIQNKPIDLLQVDISMHMLFRIFFPLMRFLHFPYHVHFMIWQRTFIWKYRLNIALKHLSRQCHVTLRPPWPQKRIQYFIKVSYMNFEAILVQLWRMRYWSSKQTGISSKH